MASSTHTHTHVQCCVCTSSLTQHVLFPSSPFFSPPIIVMVLCAAALGLCSIIHRHHPVLLLILPPTHSRVLSLPSSPWFTYILLKSSYMSADQPERQRQAWVNYLSFRADGCRWYVNGFVCACVRACVPACVRVGVCACVCIFTTHPSISCMCIHKMYIDTQTGRHKDFFFYFCTVGLQFEIWYGLFYSTQIKC